MSVLPISDSSVEPGTPTLLNNSYRLLFYLLRVPGPWRLVDGRDLIDGGLK